MSEAALEACPECGGSVKRLISGGAGAITKGSGQHFGSSTESKGLVARVDLAACRAAGAATGHSARTKAAIMCYLSGAKAHADFGLYAGVETPASLRA